MTPQFNKLSLLAALKPKTVQVLVEGFGDVGIVQLTVSEVDALRATLKKEDKVDQFGLHLVQLSVVDPNGACVFDESDLADLQGSSNAAMDGLVSKALETNGFKKAADSKN